MSPSPLATPVIDRAAAAPLIHWGDPQSWVPKIGRFLQSRLKPGALERWQKRNGLQDLYLDDIEWRTMLIEELDEDLELTTEALEYALEGGDIQIHHTCRPVNPSSYTEHGIRVANNADRLTLLQKTISYLVLPEWEMREVLRKANQRFAQPDIDLGKVFLALDERFMAESAGHYLLRGSEWQAAMLGMGNFAALQKRGVPTSFWVRLPYSWISKAARSQFSDVLLREWVRLKVLSSTQVQHLDFTFTLKRDIPPTLIFGHSHPETIPDPHFYGTVHRFAGARCELCRLRT
jgi:hypothetical protein